MEDAQLERLYDYTKFHIGIYLSAAGGLAALIAVAADGAAQQKFVAGLVGAPWALGVAFVCVAIAGVSGAIVATSTIESSTYIDFLSSKQGAYGIEPFSGKTWVTLEHGFFWLSLLFLGVAVFSADAVLQWMFGSGSQGSAVK
jgi:hypothetical protein